MAEKNPWNEMQSIEDSDFVRRTGVSKNTFKELLEKLTHQVQITLDENPKRKRGLKEGISWENRLLLFLTYMRDYPTFLKLGTQFGISESYAHKLFHRVSDLLVGVLKLPNRKTLLEGGVEAVLVDVCEQPIESPKKRQRAYYSGKKTTYH